MTYREDDAATLRRRDELARSVASGDVLDAERDAALSEIAAIDAARIEAARVRLPQVARARIASPCDQAWDTMLGNGAVRSCSRCEKHVFDLSQMTLGQAEALIASRPSICVRLYQRADGTMMFADCEVGARGVVRRKIAVAGAALALGGAALAWASAPTPTAADARALQPSSAAVRAAADAFLLPAERRTVDYAYAMGDPIQLDTSDSLEALIHRGRARSLPPTAAHVDIGAPRAISSPSPPFDDHLLRRALRARIRSIRACYERELREQPMLAGRVVVRFTLERLGILTSVEATENTTGSDEVARCTVRRTQAIRLAQRPADERITYTVEILFAPPDRHAETSATRPRRSRRR